VFRNAFGRQQLPCNGFGIAACTLLLCLTLGHLSLYALAHHNNMCHHLLLCSALLLLLLLCFFLQVGFFDDKVGPITLAAIVMVTLVAITIMAFIDVFS
jgi:hypothetical protein